jgi:hypothetical protein
MLECYPHTNVTQRWLHTQLADNLVFPTARVHERLEAENVAVFHAIGSKAIVHAFALDVQQGQKEVGHACVRDVHQLQMRMLECQHGAHQLDLLKQHQTHVHP